MGSARIRKTERAWLMGGTIGTRSTLLHMRRLAREGAVACFLLHDTARSILAQDPSDWEAAQAIRSFLASHFVFEPDPPDRERIKAPSLMMREIASQGHTRGDCDDAATLGAALTHAVGLVPYFVVVGFQPRGPYEHVFTEVVTSRGPVDLDVTRPAQFPPGLTIQRRSEMDA